MTEKRKVLSISEQAQLIDHLFSRCVMKDGSISDEATLVIDRETAEKLDHLSSRLRRMAPFEGKIKEMVERDRNAR